MPTLPRRAYPVFGERTFQKQRQGGVPVAPAACDEKMAQNKLARRVFATEPSAPPAPKRARIGFDAKIRESFAIGEVAVLALPAHRHIKQRVQAEHDGKKAAVLLSHGTGRSGMATAGRDDDARILAARRRSEAATAVTTEAAAKRRSTSPSKHAPEAAAQQRTTGPEKQQQQQQYRVQHAATKATERKMADVIDKAQQALKRRRRAEIALAKEVFRRELLEVEKAAMPDETIHHDDLRDLGITAFEYAVTRTRKQALGRHG